MFKSQLIFMILAILLTLTAGYTFLLISVFRFASEDNAKKSDVIMVLGGKSFTDERKNLCVLARVTHAIDLYKQDMAKQVLFSGGKAKGEQYVEADKMKELALSEGLDNQVIIIERASTSTFENFIYTNLILKKNGFASLVIVTDPYHSYRASLVAQKLHMQFTVSPAKASPCSKGITELLTEPFAIAAYMLTGKI